MKALVLKDFGRMVVSEVERPEPGPEDVLIAVTATGICGSDIHGYTGENGRRVPGQIMGHESEGVVTATGTNVDSQAHPVGSRVTFNPVVVPPSDQAEFQGREQHSASKYVIGVRPDVPAAFAQFVVVPARNVVTLPEDLPVGYGALIEPLAVAVHAVRRVNMPEGARVVVIGGGPIGQSLVLALSMVGIDRILVSEPDEGRRELLRRLGVQVVDPGTTPLPDAVEKHFSGPADVAMDAVGVSATLREALQCVRLGGDVCLVGMGAPTIELDAFLVSTGERSIVGSFTYSADDFRDAAAWIASAPPGVEHLISRHVPFEDGPEAFARLAAGESTPGKVLIRFDGGERGGGRGGRARRARTGAGPTAPDRAGRTLRRIGGGLLTVALLVGVQVPSALAVAPLPVPTSSNQTQDAGTELMLGVIERFVDRAEDFWREDQGTFAATGSGVTQPRGEGNIAMAYATLLTARPGQQTFGTEQHDRSVLLAHAESTIRHAAATNRSQGGSWGGGTWQAALETYGWGLAAYMLRDQLAPETLALAGEVIRYEADILIDKPAADATAGNTGAEDNAWNSPLPVLAAGWWPEQEHAGQWHQAAQRFAVNASTIPGDTEDSATLIDGRPLSEWAETANLLPDLTMENHGFFNPLYQQVAGFNLGEGILIHEMTGQDVPEAFEFRTERIYDEILAPLVTPDGDLLLTHGQDWVAKDYQHLGYLTMMGTWYGRADATEYAGRALATVASRQAARSDGAILGQDDVGYETVLVKRLASAYLMHQNLGPAATTDASGMAEIEADREGTHLYPASKFVVHRLDGTLRSVNWTANRPMALMVPDGTLHEDPVLAHYRPGNLIGNPVGTVTAASCDCGEASFAVAEMVGGRGYAVASLPNGLMPALEAGHGAAFPVALENIEGVTGPWPVVGPDGPITDTADVPWFSIDGRLGMVVQGGAGVSVQHDAAAGANRIDVVTGSVAGGDGQRAAVLLADHTADQVAQVATSTSRPAAPAGWQAVQATALDGTVGVLVARFTGPSEATITLAGGPVLPSGVVLDGDTSHWDLTLDEVSARAEVAPATATSTAPVTASAPRPDLVVLTNDGDSDAQVSVSFAAGAAGTGLVPAGRSVVAVLIDGQVLFGHPALAELTQLPSGGPSLNRLVSRAIDALAAGNLNQALNHISLALRQAEGTDLTPGLSSAAATLVGISLTVPKTVELVRTDEPHQVEAQLKWAPGDWRTATSTTLELSSDLAGAPVEVTDNRLRPGRSLTAVMHLAAEADASEGELIARAQVRLGPGTLVLEERAPITTLAPIEVTATPEAVTVGGDIERTMEITVTNRLARELQVEVTITGPDGLTITPPTGQLSVPVHDSASTNAVLVRDGVSDGRHTLEVTVTPVEGNAVHLDVPVHTSDELALNPFGTGYPVVTATSVEGPYLASRANDGDLGTFWVSAGTQDGEGPTPQDPELLTIELGGATTVGAVEVLPRVNYGPRDMVIEGRVDGDWVELAEVVQPNSPAEHGVTPTVVDAVRLVITSVYDPRKRNVQVIELRLSKDSPPPPEVNLALGADTASSSQHAAYPSEFAVDGNPASFWVSFVGATPEAPQWLSIDLGREVEVSRLGVVPRINGPNDHGPRHMVWQVGDGVGNWTDLVAREKPRGGSDTVDVEVTTRHVRLLITSVWDARNDNVQVAEAQVFGH